MSETQIERLTRFANQIGRNFIAIGHDRAVLATADHIARFWDPRMKTAIFEGDRSGLDPVAARAIEYLARGGHPQPQTRATQFAKADDLSNSDAG